MTFLTTFIGFWAIPTHHVIDSHDAILKKLLLV